MDDPFCIMNEGAAEEFLSHLNSLKPTIHFTMELETELGRLPFLDARLQRYGDDSLATLVYRKPTHTDQFLQYDSHHRRHVKRGVVRCPFERAQSLAQGRRAQEERERLKQTLEKNGYPPTFIRGALQPRQRTEEQQSPKTTSSSPTLPD